jgi:hypothetical protein
MNDLVNVIGILGAYFAVLLVLAVAIETILDPFTLFKGLQKKVSPEEFMKDMKEWLPKDSKAETNATAIANFVQVYDAGVKDIQSRAKELGTIADDTAKALGLTANVTDAQKQLAIQMYAIRSKYNLDEQKRIVVLRILSAGIGILLAVILQIDTFEILGSLFSKQALAILSTPIAHYGGMALTGLAASAGSSFWHDQLVKVRALKEATQKVQEVSAR